MAGLPYLLYLVWIRVFDQILEWSENSEYLQIEYHRIHIFIFVIPLTVLFIIFIYIAWKQDWPVWSGSWVGIALAFIHFTATRPSWRVLFFMIAALLLMWITLRDRKTVVLATLPLTLIVAQLLYRDIYGELYFYQIQLALLSLIAFIIYFTRKWVLFTLAGLLALSAVNIYALMNFNSYMGQSPYLPIIPIYDDALTSFFFLSFSWQFVVVFIPLLLAKSKVILFN